MRTLVAWMLSVCLGAGAWAATDCSTSVTVQNQYGQYDGMYLFVRDPSNNTLISLNFPNTAIPLSNGQTTVSLTVDQNGKPVNLQPGLTYSMLLEPHGAGPGGNGPFSNYVLTLSGDLAFSDGTRTKSGLIHFAGVTQQFHLDTSSSAVCPVLFDPQPSLLAPGAGAAFVQDPQTLATQGRQVGGVSADGVTRVLIRIPANINGQIFTLSMFDDPSTQSASVAMDGGLGAVDQVVQNAQFSSAISNIVAQNVTINGQNTPVALAVYQAPPDFSRPPGVDDAASVRDVYLNVASGVSSYLFRIHLVRPPVILIHGLVADQSVWDNFEPIVTDHARFAVARVDYSDKIPGVTQTTPQYSTVIMTFRTVRGNELGFEFNAPRVWKQLQDALQNFRFGWLGGPGMAVAASQVDVVAHSMGGVLTRTMPYVVSDFFSYNNYFQGAVHKLITVGTPHLGSPLAIDILSENVESYCMAVLQSAADYIPMDSALIDGYPKSVSGAHYDLQGDGFGNWLSPALQRIQQPILKPFRAALLAGSYDASQATSAPFNVDARGQATRAICFVVTLAKQSDESFVLRNYSSQQWPVIFGGLSLGTPWPLSSGPSDGIVPVNSALNGAAPVEGVNLFSGAIHGPGTHDVGFDYPSLLDPGSLVPNRVVELLNEPIAGPSFRNLP